MSQDGKKIKKVYAYSASEGIEKKNYRFIKTKDKDEQREELRLGFVCFNISKDNFIKNEKGYIYKQRIRSSKTKGWLEIVLKSMDFNNMFTENNKDCYFEGSEDKFNVHLIFMDSTLPIDQRWFFTNVECHFSLDYLDEKESAQAKQIKEKHSREKNTRTEEIRNSVLYNGSPYPKAFRHGDVTLSKCPVCQTALYDHYSLLLTKDCKQEIIRGKACRKCRCLYVDNADYIFELLKDNEFTGEYTLDGKYYGDYSLKEKKKEKLRQRWEREKKAKEVLQNKKQLLQSIEAAELMLCISYNDGKEEDIIIVDNLNAANSLENRIWYASENGREYLTAAFHYGRNKKGTIYGREYQVKTVIYKTDTEETTYRIFLDDIVIRKDGGLTSSLKNSDYQLVDVLLYSPYKDRFELIRATLNTEDDDCFVSGLLFRKFVNQFGNPGIDIIFGRDNRRFGRQFSELNDESVLKEFGYTVSQDSYLSTEKRQEILAEIIDLDILSSERILRYLDFFIQTHPSTSYELARLRWAEDFQFVSNYKANPERFLISQ